jgi:DNA polymerase
VSRLLRRGRLEVETDILLGCDLVALPSGSESIAGDADSEPRESDSFIEAGSSSRTPEVNRARGFDAQLFATSASGADSEGGVRPSNREEISRKSAAPRMIESRPDDLGSGPADAGSATSQSVVPLVDRIVPPGGASNADRLLELERMHANACPHCTTATAHTRLVFGEGDPDAELVFVGEAPGENEDQLGRPFVGRAGEKLDEMIAAMGLRREDVYIANVLKSRPPANRTPLAHEIDACGPYLLAQLAIIRPKAIVTLGGPASKLLLASELGITRLRGVPAPVQLGNAAGSPFTVPVMPTFHPAYLLRNYTPETRRQVWEDLKQVLGLLGRDVPGRTSS